MESQFLRALRDFDIRVPAPDEWTRIAELVDIYQDLPLGGTDASVIALAESLDTSLILTLDRRHFSVVRDRRGQPFQLLPD